MRGYCCRWILLSLGNTPRSYISALPYRWPGIYLGGWRHRGFYRIDSLPRLLLIRQEHGSGAGQYSSPVGLCSISVNKSRLETGISFAPWIFHVWCGGFALLYIVAAREIAEQPWNYHIASPAIAALAGIGFVKVSTLDRYNRELRTLARAFALSLIVLASSLIGVKEVKQTYLATADSSSAMPWRSLQDQMS